MRRLRACWENSTEIQRVKQKPIFIRRQCTVHIQRKELIILQTNTPTVKSVLTFGLLTYTWVFNHLENLDSQSYAHFPNVVIFHIERQPSLKSPMLTSEKTCKLYKTAKLTQAAVLSYIWCFLESLKFFISHTAVSSFFEGTGSLCSFSSRKCLPNIKVWEMVVCHLLSQTNKKYWPEEGGWFSSERKQLWNWFPWDNCHICTVRGSIDAHCFIE